ncbi:DMT family transporter [Shimia thalassica]|uniref:DMT family transporter n=1 Tax=Shimia thalassica TaxID=1715693 RepID=UPI001C09CE83|nr:DMT family transporter [Shimia thalassica]MBU2943930.1 DMT family transporter [Shimia thalassica]MDO6480415.1 DMT family transporter [Shimia thalassica]MDO6503441.1 DMT family transporter [Shimia thalassica]
MTHDRPLLGIGLMLCFCVLAPLGDAVVKIIGQTVPLGQLVFARFAIQAAILFPIIWMSGRTCRMSPRVFRLTVIRTLLHIIGIAAMVSALRFLPLADAVAIAFVMPFLMLLLGKYVLGEEVGSRRLMACVVGFIGTLLVIQPSFSEVGAPALLPLVVAVVFALFMLVTRQIAKETDPISLQAVSGAVAMLILTPFLFLGAIWDLPELSLVQIPQKETWLLLSTGILGTLAHLLMTWSLRYAPSATLAPMQYLEIPFATLMGWAIFGDLPNSLASLGIMITMSSGLYILFRERTMSRVAPPVP